MKRMLAVMFVFAFLFISVAANAQQPAAPPASSPPAAGPAGSGQPAPPPGHGHHGHGAPGGQMMEHCKEMQAKHEQNIAKMKQMDAALDQKVAAMNQATGDKKVDAMAAVINEMVSQRKEMREMFMGAHHCGMMHMMGQMGPGMKGMAECPMMQQMQKGQGQPGTAASPPQGQAPPPAPPKGQ